MKKVWNTCKLPLPAVGSRSHQPRTGGCGERHPKLDWIAGM